MGFALSLERTDPSGIRATTRFKADDPAAMDLWARAEAEAVDSRVPRDRGIAPVAQWVVGRGTDLAQRRHGAFGCSSRNPVDRSLVECGAPGMLTLSPATRIFVALEPVDLRQSFNGLSARLQSVLAQEPLSGHLFLFTNRSRNRVKVIFFDGSGLWVCAKRLEKGTFGWPRGKAPAVACGRKS
jgi:transposase